MSILLNPHTHTAIADGTQVKLTRLEYRLLDFLVRNADRVCSRDEIIDAVWGTHFCYDTGTVDVHLNAIRRKMSWDAHRPIQTVRGVGLCYRPDAEPGAYAFNLEELLTAWLRDHEAELAGKGLVPQLKLDPFVSRLGEQPEVFLRMLDAVLAILLPSAAPGYIRISTALTVCHFSFTIDINGTTSCLKIPLLNRES